MESYSDSRSQLHSEEAAKYLKEHKIMELFENMTSMLVYERPENPKQFFKGYIEKLQKARSEPDETSPPAFFDEANLRSVFGMLDVTRKGYVSHDKYLQAMSNLGLREYNATPAGTTFDKISQETFVREVQVALTKATATFSEDY